MSPESLKAYHAANPSPEQEIADLRARLQTAEQQLTQSKELHEFFFNRSKDLESYLEAAKRDIEIRKGGLQTAEQQLGQVRKSLQNIIRYRGERDKVFITARSALDRLDAPSDGCGKWSGGVMSYGPFRDRIKALATELRAAGFEYPADCVAVADFDCPDWSPEEENEASSSKGKEGGE